jgi:hypothetical protein
VRCKTVVPDDVRVIANNESKGFHMQSGFLRGLGMGIFVESVSGLWWFRSQFIVRGMCLLPGG